MNGHFLLCLSSRKLISVTRPHVPHFSIPTPSIVRIMIPIMVPIVEVHSIVHFILLEVVFFFYIYPNTVSPPTKATVAAAVAYFQAEPEITK